MRRPPPDVAMILAAGFGTRMGALTAKTPKPLLTVGGRSLLARTLDICVDAGVRRAVVNLHYRGDQIRAALAARSDIEIAFSEEEEILETGGGVAAALDMLGDAPFYTLNSDAVWTGPSPLRALANAWRDEDGALLNLVARENAVGYVRQGDFSLGEDGGLVRRGNAPAAPYVYTGAQIISPNAFADAPSGAFSMNVIWDALRAEGRLRGARHAGRWVDVGTPEGLTLAAREIGS